MKLRITTDYIKLDSFLKLSGAAATGGHAKQMILDGLVKVNSEECFLRGKKLKTGDKIQIQDEVFEIV